MGQQIRALFLGLWYASALATSVVGGLKLLADDHLPGLGTHYVFAGILWAAGVGLSSYFAGVRSQKYPVIIGTLSALLPPLLFAIVLFPRREDLEFTYPMEPLPFGWTPGPFAAFIGLSVIVIIAGTIGGLQARSFLRSGESETDEQLTLGIKRRHWLWLWIPMSTWACALPSAVYLIWLVLALGWHWIAHPSIWFNWRWLLFFSFGVMTTYLPYAFLSTGITEALAVVSQHHDPRPSAKQALTRFIGWGYGCAFLGVWISVLVAEWVLSKLPIVSDGKPWWILF